MINAEMSRLSAREIAQRFLKSIMKQVGVLSSQNPDGDEDETINNAAILSSSEKHRQAAQLRDRCGPKHCALKPFVLWQ
jgi:hypothetical protein